MKMRQAKKVFIRSLSSGRRAGYKPSTIEKANKIMHKRFEKERKEVMNKW